MQDTSPSPCRKRWATSKHIGRFVKHPVVRGRGFAYQAHNFRGDEITSDSLRNLKAACRLLGWTVAEIEREDGLPEWITPDGRNACETFTWHRRRKRRQGRGECRHDTEPAP